MKGTRKEGVGNSGRYLGKNISKRTCHLYKKGWTNFLGKGAVALYETVYSSSNQLLPACFVSI